MTKPIIAAQLYTVRERCALGQIAEGWARSGRLVIHLAGIGIGEIAPEHLKELLDREQLTVCATHVPWGRLQQDLDNLIAEHKLLGCKHIGQQTCPAVQAGSGRLGQVCPGSRCDRLEDQGSRFAVHLPQPCF